MEFNCKGGGLNDFGTYIVIVRVGFPFLRTGEGTPGVLCDLRSRIEVGTLLPKLIC